MADLYRRLHVIIGDANHCDVANLLKLGTTSLVLAMIEDRAIDVDLTVARPVATLQAVSHDPTCTAAHRAARRHQAHRGAAALALPRRSRSATSRTGMPASSTATPRRSCGGGRSCSTGSSATRARPSRELDWVAKQQVLQGYIDRDGLDWTDSRLRAIDIQWSDVRPDKGIFHKLRAAGRFEELVTESAVLEAVHEPPHDTRAYFRGKCLEKYPDQIAAASWDSVIFDIPGQTVPAAGPDAGAAAGHQGRRRGAVRPQSGRSHPVA